MPYFIFWNSSDQHFYLIALILHLNVRINVLNSKKWFIKKVYYHLFFWDEDIHSIIQYGYT
jgi:hypothetical protein